MSRRAARRRRRSPEPAYHGLPARDYSGPGTLREACEAGGPRIVVFNVAGIIKLKSHIRVRAPYITISGATAPGDGVCIAGDTLELETHDVIVRYLRFRRAKMDVG